MKIDAFKTMVAQGGSGRVTSTDGGTTFQSITNRLGGKPWTKITDYFARNKTDLRAVQNRENRDTRLKLSNALRQAYGPNVPTKVMDSILQHPNKPITRSEVKNLILQTEKAAANATITITLPGVPNPVQIARSTVPPEIASKTTDLANVLQAKVRNGRDLLDIVVNGQRDLVQNPPTKKEVSDIMWFLHLRAEASVGSSFKEGAITTPDAQQKLRNFFDACPESYRRISSHIKEMAAVPGGGHRGIDFANGKTLDEVLPHGKEHVLYGAMIVDTKKFPQKVDMLFMKLEGHGCRLSPLTKNHRSNVQDRGLQRHDLRHFIAHTFSFLHTRGVDNDAVGLYKERIHTDVKNAFNNLVGSLPSGLKEILEKDKPLGTGGGIGVMIQNFANAARKQEEYLNQKNGAVMMRRVDLDNDEPDEVVQRDLGEYTDPEFETKTRLNTKHPFFQLVLQKYGRVEDDTYDMFNVCNRVGNEVILRHDELAI